MKLIIKLFGILFLLAGLSLLVNPSSIIGGIENNVESTWLYIFAIEVRAVLGILFIVAAKESKYPRVLKFIGYLFVITAITFVFLGQERFQDLLTSLIPNVKPYAQVAGLLSMAFGGFLIYAFSRKKALLK